MEPNVAPVPVDLTEPANLEQLVTEDDTPVDNLFSGAQQRLLANTLDIYRAEQRSDQPFVAMANVGLFYSSTEPPVVPDFLLSLNVKAPSDMWAKKNRSYFVFNYRKVPEVVIEIVSNDEGGEDDAKLALYARIGITYYIIHDPQQILSQEVLRAFVRNNGGYDPIAPEWLPAVSLGLTLWKGECEGNHDTWLRWIDHEGQLLPTSNERAMEAKQKIAEEHQLAAEERHRAEVAAALAEQEKQRAEQEKQRAEQEKLRADRLAAQLRALGLDPEA